MQALLGAAATKIPTAVPAVPAIPGMPAIPGLTPAPSLTLKIPVWLYRLIAIFPVTGMAGIDHYLLGSQQTAFAKFFVNLLTFGSWYVYDILQSLDADKISDMGLDFPFYGGGAVGKGKMAADAKDLGHVGEAFLNLLFASVAGTLYLIDHYVLEKQKSPISDTAKILSPILLTATAGLLALAAYGLFKAGSSAAAAGVGGLAAVAGASSLTSMPGMPSIPSIPGMPSIPSIPGMPSIPSIPGMPSIPSLSSLTKQSGGAKIQGPSTDFLALGILTLIAATGFTLSAVRSRGAL